MFHDILHLLKLYQKSFINCIIFTKVEWGELIEMSKIKSSYVVYISRNMTMKNQCDYYNNCFYTIKYDIKLYG